jgi:thioredoxin reductase (NADPH)
MDLKLDKEGYVVVDKMMKTSTRGIFSAGDLNSGNFKQAVIATAEGAIAANAAYEEIKYETGK